MSKSSTEQLEQLICELPDVRAARIATAPNGKPTEIHVLAHKGKPPKYLARDIVSMAMAEAHLEIDYRIVSIVELGPTSHKAAAGDDSRPNDKTAKRISLASVNIDNDNISVALKENDNNASASASVKENQTPVRAVAVATLSALRQLEPNATHADIETANVLDISDRKVAVVTIVAINEENKELVFAGSAIVRDAGEYDSVVRAVLDGTNRRLGKL